MIEPPPILSLYRSYLRQVRALPHLYLRQFFQIRARDDVNAILSMKGERRREIKFKSIQKRVQKIEKANNRDIKAFNYLLSLAYGRVGKLKWELLEPVVSHPTGPLPEPIIRGVEKSRPPVYSPELKVLLTSSLSRVNNKPLERKDLINPRTLPPRANPLSEEARTFGPFSKRREVNIRQRFFRNELKKILPPLELSTKEDVNFEVKTLPRPLGMQGSGVVRDLERIIGDELFVRPPKPRRESRGRPDDANSTASSEKLERHPSRWLRRRYRFLLSSIPQLVYNPKLKADNGFLVAKHSLGHHPHDREDRCMPDADPINMAWIEQSETKPGQPKNEQKRREG